MSWRKLLETRLIYFASLRVLGPCPRSTRGCPLPTSLAVEWETRALRCSKHTSILRKPRLLHIAIGSFRGTIPVLRLLVGFFRVSLDSWQCYRHRASTYCPTASVVTLYPLWSSLGVPIPIIARRGNWASERPITSAFAAASQGRRCS